MIYFVQRVTGGSIKIGTSIVLSERLANLKSQHRATLKVLGVMQGDQKREHKIHQRFAAMRIAGEWFKPEPELMAFIGKWATEWNGVNDDAKNENEFLSLRSAARMLGTEATKVHGRICGMASIGNAEYPIRVGRAMVVRRIDVLKILVAKEA